MASREPRKNGSRDVAFREAKVRTDRLPKVSKKTHRLAVATPGKNRFHRGVYLCSCGQSFTGLNQYETHRARERRGA